ncbi:MAG: long-chain fatty acid--CoA ligase [Solirubrobacterales bacterium]
MLEGLMQNDFQLTIPAIARRLDSCYGDSEVITLREDGPDHVDFATVSERVSRLARALDTFGIEPGDRVGTFAWNNQRHFELYFAVPSVGAVLHTVNVRLFPEQIAYVIHHAGDRVVFIDDSLVPAILPLLDQLPNVERWVVMGEGRIPDGLPNAVAYEELLEDAGPGSYDFPEIDERQAASLCYTSGTTGNPKGVLYSHRSIALHSTTSCMTDSIGLSAADRLLAIVPMFHVNAWGLPYSAALTGTDLIMPGPFLQGPPLARLIEIERATLIAGVPTVLSALLDHVEREGGDLSSLRGGICGGAAVPRSLMEGFERHGVEILQAWGMTETAPLLSIARPPAGREGEESWSDRVTAGRVSPWVEARIVGDDGLAPHDGEAVGEVQVRGPWVASAYYRPDEGADEEKFDGEWLRTGDIGAVDPRGFVRLTDRAKDLIKSGGEWISSVELETSIAEHPSVREAAVIAIPDDRWSERPLACVVLKEGREASPAEIREHLGDSFARWQLPDSFAFVEEIPKTSVGKLDKKVLRADFAEGRLPVVHAELVATND